MARIHLRPISAEIVIPLETIAQRSDAERLDRARMQIRALVNNLQLGGGVTDDKAWETVTQAFIIELSGDLALETDIIAEGAITFITDELRAHTALARGVVAA